MTITMSTVALAGRAAWSMICVNESLTALRQPRTPEPPAVTGSKITVVVPLLDEADNIDGLVRHWHDKLTAHPRLRLCVCTTEREVLDSGHGPTTWEALAAHPQFKALQTTGRAHMIHYPDNNRTYGEQLRWALDRLTDDNPDPDVTHLYITNVDSRLSNHATHDLLHHVDNNVDCAQQSALFLSNLDDLNGPAAAEALYQSRWTLEREYFRYLAGSGRIPWIPASLARRWYQHAVGHGLLISTDFLDTIGGLPTPRHGLEDAALGFLIRALGRSVEPMPTLECGSAPTSITELQRQRMTWIRGPLCAPEYGDPTRHPALATQGLYDGLKWAIGLPLLATLIAKKRGPDRYLALLALVVELYGPALQLIVGLGQLEIDQSCQPSPRQFTKALTWYPTAPINYTLGGLRGLIALLRDLATGHTWVQPRTRTTNAQTHPTS